MIYCCSDHVEMVLEEIVDEYKTFPILQAVNKDDNLSTTCEYCQKPAAYIVEN